MFHVCILCGAPPATGKAGDPRGYSKARPSGSRFRGPRGRPADVLGVVRPNGRRRIRRGALLCEDCRSELPSISGDVCRRCGRPLISEIDLCTACRERSCALSNRAALEYRGRPRELIALYKLSGRRSVGSYLADFLIAAVGEELRDSVLVPVPASPERRRLLGWDPVYDLATRLVAPLGVEVRCLLSRKPGRQQKELGYLDRLENASRLFQYSPESSMGNWSPGEEGVGPLVLFDDIFTTGATLDVCRQILLEVGLLVERSFTLAVD